ncbi:MAG TPA: nucleotide-binding protein [Thermoanaerobaculia bacterium]|nr:nucleotide-binding protein [Thermoanaerobaculia bacterium]
MSDWRTYVENFYRQSPSEQHRLWTLLSSEQRAAFLTARQASEPASETPQAALRDMPPPRPGATTLSDDIDHLIRLGRELGSSSRIFIGLSAKRTNEYLAWRLRCITLFREMGPRAEHLLATVERRKPMYYQAFQAEILGALEAARDILSRTQASSPQVESKIGNFRPVMPEPDAAGETRVFIVHGHDPSSLQQAARLMEQLDLVPIILAEEVSRGRTIIEKLEERARAHAALILLTPDDVGSAAADAPHALKPRARQNVILELGYFLGLLGRHRVVVLYTPGIELPSDFVGVEYIKLDGEGAWKLRVARELRAGNLPVNLNNMS